MNLKSSLLTAALIKPFYRENAGLLCFIYYMMFIAVGHANGVGVIEYHYSLIRGMLINPSFLAMVFCVWAMYTLRCVQYITGNLQKPEYLFLFTLTAVKKNRLFLLLLQIHGLLFLPVLSYVSIIVVVGYHDQLYTATTLVIIYNILLCLAAAWRYMYALNHPGFQLFHFRWNLPAQIRRRYYIGFLLKYVLEEGKALFLATKIYNCGILFMLLKGRNPMVEPDLRMTILFYCFGLLGHGVMIHRLKELENTRLTFYRQLPVHLVKRFADYALFYLFIFVPEIIMIGSQAPVLLTYREAAYFIFFGYGTILHLNSLQLFNYTGLRDYFKTVMQLFVVFLLSLISETYIEFSVMVFVLAVVLFFTRYYRFEPQPNNVMR